MRGKLRSDPAYGAVFELLRGSPLPVLDIGCGIGLLEFYLREHSFAPPLVGIDFDESKIGLAQAIAGRAYRDLTFKVGDALNVADFHGNVVVLDVLHYLPAAHQAPLLDRLAGLVAPGGVCLVRATPRDEGWRFQVTRLQEFVLHAMRWMKSGALHYPAVDDVIAPFLARGFACEVRPLWGRTPFNSHLFVFRAPAVSSSAAREQNTVATCETGSSV